MKSNKIRIAPSLYNNNYKKIGKKLNSKLNNNQISNS